MPPEIQLIFVILSITVIIIAMVIAGYIFIRNNRQVTPEVPSIKEKSPALPPEDANVLQKTVAKTVKELEALPTSEGDQITSTPAKELKPLPPPTLIKKTIVPLKISNLIIQPTAANPSELITIRFSTANFDNSQVQHDVILKIDDRVFNTRMISILPGTIQHLNFKVLITEPGSYTADVNGTTGVFTIGQ
ncbi:MAG: hypothetical protein ABSA18_14965 [Dehalococcoidia bacterium]